MYKSVKKIFVRVLQILSRITLKVLKSAIRKVGVVLVKEVSLFQRSFPLYS